MIQRWKIVPLKTDHLTFFQLEAVVFIRAKQQGWNNGSDNRLMAPSDFHHWVFQVENRLHGPRAISIIPTPAGLYSLVSTGQFHKLSLEQRVFLDAHKPHHQSPSHRPMILTIWLTNAKNSTRASICISSLSPEAALLQSLAWKRQTRETDVNTEHHASPWRTACSEAAWSSYWSGFCEGAARAACAPGAGLPAPSALGPSCWGRDCCCNYRFLSVWFGSWMVRHYSELERKTTVLRQASFVSIPESFTPINLQNATTTKLMNLTLKQESPPSWLWMINQ